METNPICEDCCVPMILVEKNVTTQITPEENLVGGDRYKCFNCGHCISIGGLVVSINVE